MIQKALLVILSIPSPRPFQFNGVHHCAFKDDTYLVEIFCTPDGNYLIPQIAGILRRAVCIYLVPLIGLGSDQVGKAMVIEHNIEPNHVNEHHLASSCVSIGTEYERDNTMVAMTK